MTDISHAIDNLVILIAAIAMYKAVDVDEGASLAHGLFILGTLIFSIFLFVLALVRAIW